MYFVLYCTVYIYSICRSKKTETNEIKMATVHRLVKEPKIIGSPMAEIIGLMNKKQRE